MDEAWSVIATQLPAAALFAIFAFILVQAFLKAIKEEREAARLERNAFLLSLAEITEKIHALSGDVSELKEAVQRKRGL